MNTVANSWVLATILLAGSNVATDAEATVVYDLSTGIDDSGNLIGFGVPDSRWVLVNAPAGVPQRNATVVPRARPSFVDFEPLARWVSPSVETGVEDAPFGLYTYEASFILTSEGGIAVTFSGEYAADNRLIDIRLNGTVAFIGPNSDGLSCPGTGCEEFIEPIEFVIDDQALFRGGLNLVQVTIENQGPTQTNPTSFVLRASVEAAELTVSDPSSIALLAIGFIGFFIACGAPAGHRRISKVTVLKVS